jgi:tRNA (cytidine32/guanosine34-2'-O)-methyltransferase
VPVDDDDTFPIKSSKDPGTWRIVQSLGFGAFASVWSAKPVTPSAAELVQAGVSPIHTPDPVGVCAVKMVDRKACARSSRNASAFYREVEVLRHLVHQGVVGYVAHFSTASHHCLVLERLQGGELFSLVEVDANRSRMLRPGPNDPEGHGLVRRIFGELSRAVSWLHEVEVVHRDIKLESELGRAH